MATIGMAERIAIISSPGEGKGLDELFLLKLNPGRRRQRQMPY